jgi:anaerobic magnesium-protoporphyrin IX monomethyl ester cyclase
MKIALVHPAGSNWIRGRKDLAAVANRMAPIGILSIAAFLRRGGHEVFVHDCLGPGAVPGIVDNARRIMAKGPDMVGFSATTSGFPDACRLASQIKKMQRGVVTVFGGVHISSLGGLLLDANPAIDYLVIGEGEETLRDLADGRDPRAIDGLVRRECNGAVAGGPRRQIADLDGLPFPAYDLLAGFPRGYNLPLFSYTRVPGATMVTSRGCPYQCSYCDRSVFRRGFRYNSAPYIYDHLKHLRDQFGVRHVNIYDDLFTMNRERIEDLCRKLIDRSLGMNFNCAVRVGHADDGLLRLLKRAGCLMVSLGIESADPALLKRHKSGVTTGEVRDTVDRIRRAGLRAKGLFMMGLPGETEETIARTSDFVLSLGLDDMNMAKFTPFPGAPLWASIREEGPMEEDWEQMNCLNFVFVPRGIASRERLDELYNRHVKRFYSDRAWRRRFVRRLWQHRWSLLHLVKNLPSFLSAMRNFEPVRSDWTADGHSAMPV